MINIKLIESFKPPIQSHRQEKRVHQLEHHPSNSHIKQRQNKLSSLKLMSSANGIAKSKRVNQFKSQSPSHFLKMIDFTKEMAITQEEYDEAISQANLCIENFKVEFIDEICHLNTLSSIQRHLLELVSYIIGYEVFDWNYIRNQFLFGMKAKLTLVSYAKLSLDKINQLLNRLLVDGEFPRFILPYSIDHLFKWTKCQIKIIIYLFQIKETLTQSKQHETISNNNNQETQTVTTQNQIRAKARKKEIIMMPQTLKAPLSPIYSKGHNKHNRIDHSPTQSGQSSITTLPKVNDNNKKKHTTCFVNEQSIELDGYDYLRDKYFKENHAIQFLPLLHNRSINQIKKIYYANSDSYYKRHKKLQLGDDLKHNSLNVMNRDKLISMLANKRSVALNSLSGEKLLELISE